ncbi:MAG: tetratricopeptide repeat protein [Alphaproteobacteria bacterium]|nr:tetratricopeptide repeat protein [Alphaproteobacteria bacterium]
MSGRVQTGNFASASATPADEHAAAETVEWVAPLPAGGAEIDDAAGALGASHDGNDADPRAGTRDADPPPRELARYRQAGQAAMTAQRYEDAARAYIDAIALSPNEAELRIGLSSALLMLGEVQEAAREADWACRLDPNNLGGLLHCGAVFCRARDLGRAISTFTAVLALDPANLTALKSLSWAYCERGHYREAMVCTARAADLDPADVDTRLAQASILLQLGKHGEALAALDWARRQADERPDIHFLSSVCLAAMGRIHEAEGAAARAVSLDPSNMQYRTHLAAVLLQFQPAAVARAQLEEVLRGAPEEAVPHRLLSAAHMQLGDLDAAMDAAVNAARLAPEDAEFAANLAGLRGAVSSTSSLLEQRKERRKSTTRTESWAEPESRAPLFSGLRVQARVVGALLLREILTRYDTKLGYLWVILEPLAQLTILGGMFAVLSHGVPPIGPTWFFLYATGLVPYLFFVNTGSNLIAAIVSNRTLLLLPLVRPIDALVARALLELATAAVTGVIMFVGFIGFNYGPFPKDLMPILQAVLLLWVFGSGLGIIQCVARHFARYWEVVWGSVTRLLYFVSGIYFVPQMLPPWLRDIVVWNPILQGIELFRTGFFPLYNPHWLDKRYLVVCATATLFLGLAALRVFRRQLTENE